MSTCPLPLVTLVTPTYNQADYLAQTIESVLAQRYECLDYVVLDDGSTDETQSVLERYSGRVDWQTQPNMGQSRTLNKGWSAARGEFIGYLSSDDLLAADAVAAAAEVLAREPEVVAVYCDFDLIDAQGHTIRTVKAKDYSEREMIEDLVCFPGPGAFFRRDAFERVGGWNPDLRQVPDFDFWLRLSALGSFRRLPRVLAHYRIHDESASFRKVPAERSDEIIAVVDGLWRSQGSRLRAQGYSQRRSRSMAELIASRSHFSSGRMLRGLLGVFRAWRSAPSRICESLAWRILVGGLLRRPLYLVRAAWRRLS